LWLAWHQVDALRERCANSGRWQIPAVFKALARASSTSGKWPAGSNSYGSGVINAAALLKLELPHDGVAVKAAAADAGFDAND
jgi:hypothetical protein